MHQEHGIQIIYFCEQARTSSNSIDFTCENNSDDGYGLIGTNIALLTYEETIYAGSGTGGNDSYYIYDGRTEGGWLLNQTRLGTIWQRRIWRLYRGSPDDSASADYSYIIRPVINLKANVTATKDANGHYVVN